MATNKIREEEVKNKIRQEFFQDYDATPVLGDIDFAVTTKRYKKTQEDGHTFQCIKPERNITSIFDVKNYKHR